MYEQVFQRIINAAQNNSLTFFVGAGVSALSGAPKWSDLIDDMCSALGRETKGEYTSDEYLRIPQMYYYSINKDDGMYYTFIKERFEQKELVPNIIHKMLFQLNPCSFITTNFDELIEDAAVQSTQGFKSIACDNEIASINGDRYILKLHGDLKHENIVFKEEDYLNYSERFKLTETILKSIFSMNTVVFIGYGLNDYNIKLVLNWAKTLLSDQFNEPIFIYTGYEDLSREELLYQESKGVTVVECKKCKANIDKDTAYLERYKCVLDAIITCSDFSIDGKSNNEAFDMLYGLLSPLNKLNALRKQDVRQVVGKYVYVGEDGTLSVLNEAGNILKRYTEINNLSEDDRVALDPLILEKYETISAVLLKARITHIREGHTYVEVKGVNMFADPLCINFDYCGMQEYCRKKEMDECELYQKAYYLAKMMKYEESYSLFQKVACDSFKNKNYLLHYLAQTNCISLQTGMESLNQYYNCYDVEGIKESAFVVTQREQVFDRLPTEFKNTYASLKDLHSPNLLYKYFYNAFIDGNKLQNAIESNSLEMGLTSSGKVMCRINDYIHFLLRNGLYLDEFIEFKSAVRNLMSMLVYKYSEQNKKELIHVFSTRWANEKVVFDEIDFYCFVEYFDSKSIIKLFNKHAIDTIEFQNMEDICSAIINLLRYYDQTLTQSKSYIEVTSYQIKIKTCLTLLRYMDIPQETVDYVCRFIFKQEFRDIHINDKVLFLDHQLYRRQRYSKVTAKLIEDRLLYYIDSHINSVKNGTEFEIISTSSNINYCNLIHYISPEKGYHSRQLAIRISRIIELGNPTLLSNLFNHYWCYVSSYQRTKIVAWAKESLRKKFDFDLLSLLLNYNAKISEEILNQLQAFLRIEVEHDEAAEKEKKAVEAFPRKERMSKLNQVGYWCFLGVLKRYSFSEFVGKSNIFDFYYSFSDFDFSKFDVSWVINSPERELKIMSGSKTVRDKIRGRIAEELCTKNLSKKDETRLTQVLVKYFS